MKQVCTLLLIISAVACGPGFNSRSPDSNGQFDSMDQELPWEYEVERSAPAENFDDVFNGDESTPPRSEEITPNTNENSNLPENEGSNTDLEPGNHEGRERPKLRTEDLEVGAKLTPTLYYLVSNEMPLYRTCSSSDIKTFKAKRGRELLPGRAEIPVCSKFYFKVQMEGSGLIKTRDGREHLINYIGVEAGIPRFKIVDRNVCPYGLGRKNQCLQPFISIAADRNKFFVGDVVYIPAVAAMNIRLPDGDRHLGFFIVVDTGGAIHGSGRFDFFTGPLNAKDPKNPFVQLGLQSKKTSYQYHKIKRGSRTQSMVQAYYKGRQIIPYRPR